MSIWLAGSGLQEASASDKRPPEIVGPGTWTLRKLGYGDVTLGAEALRREKTISFTYTLPAGTAQGRDHWYKLLLHSRITFSRASRSGRVYLMGSSGIPSDLRTSAQIIIDTRRHKGRLELVVDSLGLVNGREIQRVHGRTATVRFVNYMGLNSVLPGRNTLVVNVLQRGGAKVESLTVFRDTAIVIGGESPTNLSLGAGTSRQELDVGDEMKMTARVANVGGQRSRPGSVTVHLSPELESVDASTLRLAPLRANQQRSFVFRLRARHPGQAAITVSAVAGLAHPERDLGVVVHPASNDDGPMNVWYLLALPVSIGIAAMFWHERRRRLKRASGNSA